MPSFIWRPRSLTGPVKAAVMPNRISLSDTPRTALTGFPKLIAGAGAAAKAGAAGARWGGRGRSGRGWSQRLFQIRQPAFRQPAIRPSRRHRVAAVRDAAIEQLREVGALGLVGGGIPDHRRKLLDHRLDSRPRDIGAGQRRTDHRPDAACKVAYQIDLVAGGRFRGCYEKGTK